VSPETGNAVQQFQQLTSNDEEPGTAEESPAPKDVICVGWALNLINIEAFKKKRRIDASSNHATDSITTENWQESKEQLSLDDIQRRILDSKLNEPADLPETLAQIDVLALLPKLPVLPLLPPTAYQNGDHSAAELFASGVSLDAAVHVTNERYHNELDSLLLCHSDGNLRLILYDALSIGSIAPPASWNTHNIKHLQHAYHPFSQTQMLLSEVSTPSPKIALVPLSLRFLQSAGTHLQIIESQTAHLETLLQYVGESLLALHHHWNHATELPGKFMNLVTESLREKDEATVIQSLFHLAVTGNCPPIIKEWLVDQLAERGHKRWDQAVNQGYDKVVQICQQNFLPALDRCNIILNGLQGLYKYHEHSPAFDVPQTLFTLIIDVIRCLRLLGHHVLLYAADEHRQFQQFSKWLRHEIDIQASDPNSASAEENAETDLGLDYNALLEYIQGPLEESKLNAFLCEPSNSPAIVVNESRYGDLMKALDAFKSRADGDRDLLVLASHFDEWQRHNKTLTKEVTSWQRASTVMDTGLVLEEGCVRAHDMRLVSEQSDGPEVITTYVAVLPEKREGRLHIHRVVHSPLFEPLQNSVRMSQSAYLEIENAIIKDVKFIDDGSLMLLVNANGKQFTKVPAPEVVRC
jgi:anaphase-promoting complex subunit 4